MGKSYTKLNHNFAKLKKRLERIHKYSVVILILRSIRVHHFGNTYLYITNELYFDGQAFEEKLIWDKKSAPIKTNRTLSLTRFKKRELNEGPEKTAGPKSGKIYIKLERIIGKSKKRAGHCLIKLLRFPLEFVILFGLILVF